ncbi:CoA transferase [Microbaculum marinum]|uniref:CoA transferase n=1 Tax=Microbaculum marinum TaxID=1764581 RepID=A0AAW9RKA4_9HYPH
MRPLSGIRILAFEQYGAGPFGTQHLADLGAEVIKIEPAGTAGDYARGLGPYFVGDNPERSAASLFFQSFNRNKKSLTLDVTTDAGREILARLVASADATADNLRGDVPDKLGITYDSLKVHNPGIVCAHCSAYGREGPRAAWPGYDYLMQAEAGYFGLCGDPDAAPTRFGLSIVDYMAGQAMALGLVSAVLSARDTGLGRDVDIDLFSTAIFNLSYLGAWALNTDYEPGRQPRSAHPSLVPCQLYKTADGWIYLMCNKAGFWPLLCDLLGRPALAADPRFSTFPDRLRNRDELTGLLDEALSENTTEFWLGVLRGKVPVAPVLSPAEALANPYLTERGLIQSLNLGKDGAFDVIASPIRAGSDGDRDQPAPDLGGHSDEILADLGYSDDEIAEFRRGNVV